MQVKFRPIILSVLMLGIYAIGMGQQTRKDKIEAIKIAFITNKMELSPREAQVFWPIYNECNDKIEALRKERRKMFKYERTNLDSLSNKEIEMMVDGEMDFRQREVDIQKSYNQKLKQVLPVKKVAQLYLAEEAFKRELLQRLKDKQ